MKKIIKTTILLLTLISLLYKFVPNYIADKEYILQPVFAIQSKMQNTALFVKIFSITKLQEENDKLKKDLEALAYLRLNNLALKQELKELQELQNDKDEPVAYAHIKVQSFPPSNKIFFSTSKNLDTDNHHSYFLIARDSFILADGVESKGENLYIAELLSAPSRELNAFLYFNNDEDKLKVTTRGLGAGKFEFDINKKYDIKEGDTIFYKFHPLAVVVKIHEDEKSAYKKVLASVPFNLSLLEILSVIKYP